MARNRLIGLALSWPARLVFTVGLLAALGLVVDWDTARERLQEGRWWWFAAAIALLDVALVLGSIRWQILLRAADLQVPFYRTLLLYYFATLANNFLPAGVGGDVARAAAAGRGSSMARAATTVTADRVTAIACFFLLGLGAMLLDPSAVPAELQQSIVLTAVAVAILVALIVVASRSVQARRTLPERVRSAVREISTVVARYRGDRRLILTLVALGVLYQVVTVLSVVCTARAIDLRLPFALLAVVIPLVLVITLIPFSIGGFGLREGGFVVLLATASVDPGSATTLSLLMVASLALASAPGILALFGGKGRPQMSQPDRSDTGTAGTANSS